MDDPFGFDYIPEILDAEFVAKFIFWTVVQIYNDKKPYDMCNGNVESYNHMILDHIDKIRARIESPEKINSITKICDDRSCFYCWIFTRKSLLHTIVSFDPPNEELNIMAMRAISLLIAKGADINAPDWDGFSPLYYSVSNDIISMFYFLIKHGANVNSIERKGTPLIHFFPHHFMENKKHSITSYIEDINELNIFNTESNSVVTIEISLSRILIEAGLDLSISNLYDSTIISTCIEQNDVDLFNFVLENGFDVHTEDYGVHVIDGINGDIESGNFVDEEHMLRMILFRDILKEYVEGGGVATKSAKK